MTEINNSAVDTQEVAEAPVVEAPETDGQAEAPDTTVPEQVETETDNAPEEIPKNYKELQGEFTRKSQELSEIKKRYDKDLQELQTFRQMQADLKEQKQEVPQPGKTLSAKEFANLEPMEQLNYLVDQRLNERISPLQQENASLKQQLNYLVNEASSRTWNEFVTQHPDASNMGQQLAEVIQQYNMPLDKAYKFLKADQALPEAKQEVLKEIQVKKDASKLMKPVSTPTTPAESKVDSFEDAYQKTLKELGIK